MGQPCGRSVVVWDRSDTPHGAEEFARGSIVGKPITATSRLTSARAIRPYFILVPLSQHSILTGHRQARITAASSAARSEGAPAPTTEIPQSLNPHRQVQFPFLLPKIDALSIPKHSYVQSLSTESLFPATVLALKFPRAC
jgi:hypothetical protein